MPTAAGSTEERLNKIIAALATKQANQPCPKCQFMFFELVAESHLPLQPNPGVLEIGGPAIPIAVVACKRCGFLSLHALPVLMGNQP